MEKQDAEVLANMVKVIDERFRKMEARQIAADVLISALLEGVDEPKVLQHVQETIDSKVWRESGDPATSALAIDRLKKYLRIRNEPDEVAPE